MKSTNNILILSLFFIIGFYNTTYANIRKNQSVVLLTKDYGPKGFTATRMRHIAKYYTKDVFHLDPKNLFTAKHPHSLYRDKSIKIEDDDHFEAMLIKALSKIKDRENPVLHIDTTSHAGHIDYEKLIDIVFDTIEKYQKKYPNLMTLKTNLIFSSCSSAKHIAYLKNRIELKEGKKAPFSCVNKKDKRTYKHKVTFVGCHGTGWVDGDEKNPELSSSKIILAKEKYHFGSELNNLIACASNEVNSKLSPTSSPCSYDQKIIIACNMPAKGNMNIFISCYDKKYYKVHLNKLIKLIKIPKKNEWGVFYLSPADSERNELVLNSISNINPKGPTDISDLIKALDDKNIRLAIIRAIGNFKEKGFPAAKKLIDIHSQDDHCFGTQDIALTLSKTGPKVIPLLINYIQNKKNPCRHNMINALAEIAQKTDNIISMLLDMYSRSNNQVKISIILALAKLGHPDLKIRQMIKKMGDELESDLFYRLKRNLFEYTPWSKNYSASIKVISMIPNYKPLKSLIEKKIKKNYDELVSKDDWYNQSITYHKLSSIKIIESIMKSQRDLPTEKTSSLYIGLLIRTLNDKNDSVRKISSKIVGSLDDLVIPALTKASRDKNIDVRLSAIRVLGNMKNKNNKVLPILVNVFRNDKNQKVRMVALYGLEKMGDKAIPTLIDALRDKNQNIRLDVIRILGNKGVKNDKILQAFLDVFQNDKDFYVRSAILDGLEKIGDKAVPALIEALKDKDHHIRLGIIRILGNMKNQNNKILPVIVDVFQNDKNQEIRLEALDALEEIGGDAIPAIIKAVKDKDIEIRLRATNILGYMEDNNNKILPVLINVFQNDKNSKVQLSAIDGLENIGGISMPVLMQALKNTNAEIRLTAIRILSDMETSDSTILKTLINVFQNDKNQKVRKAAFRRLRRFGDKVMPILIDALEDKNYIIRKLAISSLGKKRSKALQIIPILMKKIDVDDIYEDVDGALTRLCKNNKKIIPLFKKILKESEVKQRKYVMYLLQYLPKYKKEVIPLLVKGLEDVDSSVRYLAAKTIKIFKKEAKVIIPPLIKKLKDKNRSVRYVSAEALGEIGKDAVPYLIKFIKDNDNKYKWDAIMALGNIGKEAKKALPIIRPLLGLTKKYTYNRTVVEDAIKNIENK